MILCESYTYVFIADEGQIFIFYIVPIFNNIIIRPHHSTVYVDAACCYRWSSVVCMSVYLSVTKKTAE